MYQLFSALAHLLARLLAGVGGIVLLALIVLTCLSIAGRALVGFDIGIGPIRGIYDFTEIGIASAVFAFLPFAQLQESHARVDLFQPVLPRRLDLALGLVFDALMLCFAAIMSWRLYLGMRDKFVYGETTLIAQIPVWYGYALGLVGATGFTVVALFCVLRATRRLVRTGQ